MKSDAGVSATGTKAQRHYGQSTVDSDFDADWKQELDSKVSSNGSMSQLCEDDLLDISIREG